MWRCPSCGEDVEDDFNVCWNCQRPKGGAAAAPGDEGTDPAGLVETARPDGSIEVTVAGKPLACAVCGNRAFHERNSLLNTRFATFMKLDWANADAVNYICTRCGHIDWFWAK